MKTNKRIKQIKQEVIKGHAVCQFFGRLFDLYHEKGEEYEITQNEIDKILSSMDSPKIGKIFAEIIRVAERRGKKGLTKKEMKTFDKYIDDEVERSL